MKTIILFDEHSANWCAEVEWDLLWLEMQAGFIKDYLENRRYIYLNQIYEQLGIDWDTNDKNYCYLAEFGPLDFEFEIVGENGILVILSQQEEETQA